MLHVAHKFHATNDDGEGTHWQLGQGQQETSQGLARGVRSGIGQRQPAEGYGKLIFIPRQKEREGERGGGKGGRVQGNADGLLITKVECSHYTSD